MCQPQSVGPLSALGAAAFFAERDMCPFRVCHLGLEHDPGDASTKILCFVVLSAPARAPRGTQKLVVVRSRRRIVRTLFLSFDATK